MVDVVRAMNTIQSYTDEIVLMQCNTNYTASSDNFKYINLNVLKTYRRRFPGVILGLSDHTKGHSTILGSIAHGARVIEKHFTDDNDREGPDHKFAMDPESFKKMVKYSNELFNALGDGIKRIEKNEKKSKIVQRRALRYKNNLKKGHNIKTNDIIPVRPIPDNGIPPYKEEDIIGMELNKNVEKDELVKLKDFIRDD